WLFLQTEYRGTDQLGYPVSLLFRLDPLAFLAALFSPGKTLFLSFWPAFLLIILTLLLGRFFCVWFCPLGTLLDIAGGPIRPVAKRWAGRPRFKYYLLAFLLAGSLCGLQLFGWFDPLSLFLRSLTLVLNPVWNLLANGLFDWLYQAELPLISPAADAVYPFFRYYLLAFHQPVFLLSLLTAALLMLLIALERVQPRFWCRNLCPLGAVLGICARQSLLKRSPQTACNDCSQCATDCRMGATGEESTHAAECIRCLDCIDFCPNQRVSFAFGTYKARPIDLSRRTLLAVSLGGAFAAPLIAVAPLSANYRNDLIRPPGAVAENEFLRRCIRCGECMKVCIGGTLQPDLLRGGLISLWSPVVVPRLGYCEYDCTLCGQVCPTGAIQPLKVVEKRKTSIGLAVIDKNRCLPFARGEECLVCEEHCPTGEKAIVFERRELLVGGKVKLLQQPRVLIERCIGCGICETRCPVVGRSAIIIVSEGESRARQGLLR
ncbi:MAG: 4Fe-4S binding protein, partial [Geopsychrobacter sp.]|nr:4Fe-4S binding protein [Geopsychrobacter sp.]